MTKMMIAAAIISVLGVLPGWSQIQCGDRSKIVGNLASKYGETLQASGLTANGGLLEIFASHETGSWNALQTFPGKKTCIVQAGKDWADEPEAAAERDT